MANSLTIANIPKPRQIKSTLNLSSQNFKSRVTTFSTGTIHFHSSDGRVVRASASGAVNLSLIPSRVKPMTLNLVFTASLLDAQH